MTVSLSEEVRAANGALWEAMQTHRFVADIETDRLPPTVFGRYLIYECDFVETAMLIFGHMLIKAPGLPERRWLAGVLQALAVEQIGYFERAFAAVGITDIDRSRPLPEAVLRFRNGMLQIARLGGYLDGVVIMFAAESMYAAWCARAARSPITPPQIRHWVDIHATAEFQEQAEWLRGQLDSAPGLPTMERERLAALFGTALALEIDFHHAPY